jgi:DNA polymerase-3 subunit beta
VVLAFDKGNVNISSASTELGDSKEDMPVEYDRPPIKVTYNPRYMIDMLNDIEGGKVVINIRGESYPCLIEEEEDKSYMGAIMAMQV